MARTVEAYPQEWKVAHEVLQNAKDAIQKSSEASGEINIEFDLSQQRVTITDNGRGFPHDLSLLGIGGTDKDREDDWRIQGNQGVGLKAVLFSSKSFWLESVINGQKWSVSVDNTCRYAEGGEGKLKENRPVPSSERNRTAVSYSFPHKAVSEFLKLIYFSYAPRVSNLLAPQKVAKLKRAIEWYFRTYSYAGDVNRVLGLEGVKNIQIKVIFKYTDHVPEEFEGELKEILSLENPMAVEFTNKYWDIEETISKIPRGFPS